MGLVLMDRAGGLGRLPSTLIVRQPSILHVDVSPDSSASPAWEGENGLWTDASAAGRLGDRPSPPSSSLPLSFPRSRPALFSSFVSSSSCSLSLWFKKSGLSTLSLSPSLYLSSSLFLSPLLSLFFSLSPSPSHSFSPSAPPLLPRLFSLNQHSGQLSIRDGAPRGSYSLQVRVSDKTWPDVTSTAEVLVLELDHQAVLNAGSDRKSTRLNSSH